MHRVSSAAREELELKLSGNGLTSTSIKESVLTHGSRPALQQFAAR